MEQQQQQQRKKSRMAKGKNITEGALWRARQKQQDAQRFNGMKGKRGFLVISNRGREPNANAECLAWLDSVMEANNGDASSEEEEEEEEEDIQKLVERELMAERVKQKKRRVFDLGLDCLSLVRAPSKRDPLALVQDLFRSVLDDSASSSSPATAAEQHGKQITHMEKIIPFQIICHSSMEAIVNAARELFAAFPNKGKTFAIACKLRGTSSNSGLDRLTLVKEIAKEAVNALDAEMKVDLEAPDCVIIVEVIRSITGLCVMRGEEYRAFKKLNLRGVINKEE